ncbi:MAG: peptidase S8 [Caldilinea sp. CFX5]|nr:peptidase S8 [Caldilinea sp. CFX5]
MYRLHCEEKEPLSNMQLRLSRLTLSLHQRHMAGRLALLLVLLWFPWSASPVGVLPLQPELRHWVAAHPSAKVSVIVQMHASAALLAASVAQLGGKVTQELALINALVAELPAQQVTALAATPGVRWVSLNAPVVASGCLECVNTANLQSAYVRAVGADKVWNRAPYLQGKNVTVAVVDSGIYESSELATVDPKATTRVIASARFNSAASSSSDQYGHGTHLAGIIAGNGVQSDGAYIGIAPGVNLVNVKVTDETGMAMEADVVAGLQWILNNQKAYQIRVVNLSLNSSTWQSYHTSPLAAACEILWFNGIVVVVSAGNNGTATLYPPANDPFVITVGAVDDRGTDTLRDDVIASFSAYGATSDGVTKPELVAPGRNLVSLLSNTKKLLAKEHPTHVVTTPYGDFFRMSGTSVAAPVVAGAVALLLQDEPTLTPDQVKFRLMATANKQWPGYERQRAGAGYLDIDAAVRGTTTHAANTGIALSNLLTTGPDGVLSSSVSWSSVSWSSVSWSSVSWSSDHWGDDTTIPTEPTDPLRKPKGKAEAINAADTPMVESMAGQAHRLYLPLITLTEP